MIAVLDASAAAKLVLAEVGSAAVRVIWDSRVPCVAPALVVPEVAAALTAACRGGRLDPGEGESGQDAWRSVVEEIDLHAVDAGLVGEAATLARHAPVRGADAVYLAVLGRMAQATDVVLVSFDGRQRQAAQVCVPRAALVPADLP